MQKVRYDARQASLFKAGVARVQGLLKALYTRLTTLYVLDPVPALRIQLSGMKHQACGSMKMERWGNLGLG